MSTGATNPVIGRAINRLVREGELSEQEGELVLRAVRQLEGPGERVASSGAQPVEEDWHATVLAGGELVDVNLGIYRDDGTENPPITENPPGSKVPPVTENPPQVVVDVGAVETPGGLGVVVGTLIHTAEGTVAIENVQVGDSVRTAGGTARVATKSVHDDEPTVRIGFSDGSTLLAAGSHRFQLSDGNLVEPHELRPGLTLSTASGDDIQVTKVQARTRRLYRLHLEGDEPYRVGPAGVLMHG